MRAQHSAGKFPVALKDYDGFVDMRCIVRTLSAAALGLQKQAVKTRSPIADLSSTSSKTST